MSFSVDKIYNSYGANQGIDVQAVKKIAQQIFANAQAESTLDLQNLNLSQFSRTQAFGLDLYRTNPDTAIQASLRNTDVDLKLSENFAANVQYLNSQAAQKNAENVTEYNPELQAQQVQPVEETANEPNVKINIFEPKANVEEASATKEAPKVEEVNTSALRTTDADVKLAVQTNENVQFLNTLAAKEHYTLQKTEGKIALPDDNVQKPDAKNVVILSPSQETNGSQNMNNNRRGSNPFAFYMAIPKKEDDNKEEESKPINLIA